MDKEKKITTPDEFYEEMLRIYTEISKEKPVFAYQMAVGVMCDLLTRLGFFDGVAVFDEMGFKSAIFKSDDERDRDLRGNLDI